MTQTQHRSHWTSRWTFILATAGSAIGLGNIWKFPYMTGVNGGSAFVLVFIACIAVVGLPLMMCEIMLGRRAQRNPVDGMAALAKEAGAPMLWRWVGIMGLIAGLLILAFYSVIAGWVLDYVVRAASGAFKGIDGAMAQNQFNAFLAAPLELGLWHSLFIVMTMSVVARGVNSGLEKANNILMPALFAILLVLLGYSLAEGDVARSADFMFTPDFSKVTPVVVLSALGHAFFSLSLGMGAVMVYGSYLQRHVSIARTSLFVALADTAIGLLVGLAIFSLVFANGLEPAAGPGLIFQTLPIAFGKMPGGAFIGTLFFLLVAFAAWTSAISLVEPAISWLTENTRLTRKGAALLIGLTDWLLGIAVLLSFNVWKDVHLLFGLGIFDTLDKLTTNILLPLGGLLMALFAGWVMKTHHVQDELNVSAWPYRLWRFTIRFVSPLAIIAIFLYLFGLVK
ncbi:putative sodium-dependent transporter YhdH [Sulfuricella denitrificans skB26]|uniref:Putative sodium-dependent transporter YhdH n=1 Tax=Sulfuricella denitrificans (strain DSM 22764 / NBRC 105220 / skB26) TaxID=1163617 RepID=S6AZD9_SULDS|nr:sodium-dependent transporter [Sulfuricella denitrificans]BAN33882.1 putative sodium-dependent transporter YhdH [Sulfuricella denitrificans skB26]